MTVIITMAGMGSRFTREGFTVPKYKVRARGRTLFEWSMLSLREFFSQRFILATLTEDDEEWLLSMAASLGIADAIVVPRATLSLGQAETALDALNAAKPNEEIWIYNIDTYVADGMYAGDMVNVDGCIYVFPSQHPSMSYVHYGPTGAVDKVAEKTVISEWASVGMYGFASPEYFAAKYSETFNLAASSSKLIVNGEYYVAPIFQTMLNENARIIAPRLKPKSVHILGTPEQVQYFDPAANPPLGNIK